MSEVVADTPRSNSGPPRHDRPLAVFDIDGVLADVRHRLHFLESTPQHWERFFQAADRDPLLPEGADRVRAALVDHDLLYLTGRPERTRQLTERWLARHGLPTGLLVMRDDDDYRPARYLKRDVLRRVAAQRDVASMLDDDPAVVAMLEADGWPVELAIWLPHSSTLRSAQEGQGRT